MLRGAISRLRKERCVPINASGERRDSPDPPVQAGGYDPAEVRADIAAVCDAGAVTKEDPAESGRQHDAPRLISRVLMDTCSYWDGAPARPERCWSDSGDLRACGTPVTKEQEKGEGDLPFSLSPVRFARGWR